MHAVITALCQGCIQRQGLQLHGPRVQVQDLLTAESRQRLTPAGAHLS